MTGVLEALEAELGYRFHQRELLQRALTHKSWVKEKDAPEGFADNEQLEFLGDAILGFLASEWLVARFPGDSEGRLSQLKAHLVSATHLHRVAQALNLGDRLILARNEEHSGGRQKKALLANALEALIAAIYLDRGIEAAREFVVSRILLGFHASLTEAEAIDFKGALKELTQKRSLPAPLYLVVQERGPDHAKTFVVEARVGREWTAQAEGASKKTAERLAAKTVLEQLTAVS